MVAALRDRARIGATDVEVPRFALGTGPLGGWPRAVPVQQGRETIRHAWERGVRYVDTAPLYGTGKSETMVGDVLSELPRESFALSTKVGRLLVPGEAHPLFEGGLPFEPVYDFTAEGVERSLRESCERLRLDAVDIAFIHDPDEHHAEALTQAYPALARAKAEGRVRAIGAAMNWSGPLARLASEADFDCILVAGRYTLLEQDSLDDLMPTAVERGVSIVAGGVYNSGVLANPVPGATYNYAPAEPQFVERAQRLQAVCREFDVPLRAAALQFPLAHPAVACVLVGSRSPKEIDDNLEMLATPIPDELWAALQARGLIRPDAPVPSANGES